MQWGNAEILRGKKQVLEGKKAVDAKTTVVQGGALVLFTVLAHASKI